MNKYIHVLNVDGVRITSIVDNMLEPLGEDALRAKAKKQFPDAAQYIYGGDDMLDEFLSGKAYKDGKFIPQPKPSNEESIKEQDNISNINIDNTALLEILADQEERLQALENK